MNILFTILATNKGWIYTVFATARSQAIGTASASVKLAMGIACMIVVFKMIRLSYDIMSDDQQGGFGGVRLWSVLRPVLLLVLIQSCTLWVGALDSLTNVVTTSISSTVDKCGSNEKVIGAVKTDETMLDAIDFSNEIRQAEAEERFRYQQNQQANIDNAGVVGKGINFIHNLGGGEKEAARRGVTNYLYSKGVDTNDSNVRKIVNNYVNASIKTSVNEDGEYILNLHDRNFIPMACNWLYDKLYLVIQSFAEIVLMILAMCSPWAIVISLIEPWKGALFGFISAYVQVSFWKVVAAMINFATVTFRGGVVMTATEMSRSQLNALVANAQNPGQHIEVSTFGSTGAAIALSAIVSIAGVFALMKVADIASAIIPSTNNIGSASGGASSGMAPLKGAAESAKSGAQGLIGRK